jgi:tRNA A-37 threonylcarbamoyl transferase component Bud32
LNGLAPIPRSQVELELREYPPFKGATLSFVRTIKAKHSELFEYELQSARCQLSIVIKHITESRSSRIALETVSREFCALQVLKNILEPPLKDNIPSPMLLLPKTHSIVLSKLVGTPLGSLLRRRANRMTGVFGRKNACDIARKVGEWLQRFHKSTTDSPLRVNTSDSLIEFEERLRLCLDRGLDPGIARQIRAEIFASGKEINGQILPAAARHGDFIPQNILVAEDHIALVDFEAFRQRAIIYEDVTQFSAYLLLMSRSAFYDGRTAKAMLVAFRDAYGEALNAVVQKFYLLKASVTEASELPPPESAPGRSKYIGRFEKQLLGICET